MIWRSNKRRNVTMRDLTLRQIKQKLNDYEWSKKELHQFRDELLQLLEEVENQIEMNKIHEEYQNEIEQEYSGFDAEDFM